MSKERSVNDVPCDIMRTVSYLCACHLPSTVDVISTGYVIF